MSKRKKERTHSNILCKIREFFFGRKSNMVVKKCVVGMDGIGVRVDKFLAARFTYHSRSEWQDKLEYAHVKVNDKKVPCKRRLKLGDEIIYQAFDVEEPPVNKNIEILYDDGDLVICNKPGNLPVIPAGRYHENTFYMLMYKKLGISPRLINRIDRETSGCILLARSDKMAREMQDNISTMKKTYIALVKGQVEEKFFTVRGNIGTVAHKYYRQYQGFTDDGKYSKTDFSLIKQNGDYASLFCRIHTGRMHQIRVHLGSKRCHIVGDKVYGEYGPSIFCAFLRDGMTDSLKEKMLLERQALHSYKIVFTHPFTKKRIIVKAPLPKDMKAFAKGKEILP